MSNSLPYLFIVAAVGLGFAAILWAVFDAVVFELLATDHWGAGDAAAQTGQERQLMLWDRAPLFLLTSAAFSLIIASRRGA